MPRVSGVLPLQAKKTCKKFNLSNHRPTYTLICLMAPNLPKISYISSEVILYGRLRTYKRRLTSGGKRICTHMQKNKKFVLLKYLNATRFANLTKKCSKLFFLIKRNTYIITLIHVVCILCLMV